MLIGELAKKTGLSRHTIRFYEKQGLIRTGNKNNPWNNYKEYNEATLKRLLTIKQIKEFGFTLNEVSDFLEMIANNQASCRNVSERFNDKIKKIDQKIKELKALKTQMLSEVSNCSCCTPQILDVSCPILE